MSRLSSLGREIYDRVVHRGESAHPAEPAHPTAPLAITDSEPTTRMARAAVDPEDGDGELELREEGAAASRDDLEIAQDLGALDIEQLAYGEDAGPMPDQTGARIKDGGDLYGIHIVPANDRDLVDDDEAFATGQNWVESLETRAAEGGPAPEIEVEILDEDDVTSPQSDSKDRPIADRGSAGPRGL